MILLKFSYILLFMITLLCNNVNLSKDDIIGNYSLTKNSRPDLQIIKNEGQYEMKFGGSKILPLNRASELDTKKLFGSNSKSILLDGYFSPEGIYFFKVKKGSIINGEPNETGFYLSTYIAGQVWKIN
jgi:hypothetical protein